MSQVFSDNMLCAYPKPTQEYERKYLGGNIWVDWASFAEMEAIYDEAYRDNKYFWVDGVYYHCYGAGLYRPITSGSGSGSVSAVYVTVADAGNTLIVPELSGHTFLSATTNQVTYLDDVVLQTGTILDFSAVGGVYASQRILIFYQ